MSGTKVVTFSALPAFGPMYLKVLLGLRRPGLTPGGRLPSLAAGCPSLSISANQLAAYRHVCGINGEAVPLLYPQVIASPLHLAILTHKEFPLSPMGALHLRNHVLQRRPPKTSENLSVLCALDGGRVAKAGMELDISTVFCSQQERVWESISTYLMRGNYGEPEDASPRAQLAGRTPDTDAGIWHVPRGTGRRYAKVCGDYNPIHLFPITAKLFGFKRDIVHGMWAAAACLARLDAPKAEAVQCDFLFKGPNFTNSTVRLLTTPLGDGTRFDLYCADNPKPTISGWQRTPPPLP